MRDELEEGRGVKVEGVERREGESKNKSYVPHSSPRTKHTNMTQQRSIERKMQDQISIKPDQSKPEPLERREENEIHAITMPNQLLCKYMPVLMVLKETNSWYLKHLLIHTSIANSSPINMTMKALLRKRSILILHFLGIGVLVNVANGFVDGVSGRHI